MTEFHFLRPLWLLAIILWLIVLVWQKKQKTRIHSPWAQWISPHLIPYLVVQKSRQPVKTGFWQTLLKHLNFILLSLISLLAIIALAGPTWKKLPVPVIKNPDAWVIVLDLTLSMNSTDITPSRLERAKFKILDILSLKKGDQIGLVAYSGEAHIVTPLTDDDATIASMLPALNPFIMPTIGSDPLSGIKMASQLLQQSGRKQGNILLITDDIKSKQMNTISRHLKKTPYTLLVLGIGTEQGAPIPLPNGTFLKDAQGKTVLPKLPAQLLTTLASKTQGHYQTLTVNDSDIQALLNQALTSLLSPDELPDASILEDKNFDQWADFGPWIVLIILPGLAWQFRRGVIFFLPFCLTFILANFSFIPNTQAAEAPKVASTEATGFTFWQKLWKRPDQLAQEAYQEGDYATAESGFTSAHRKALSAYHQQKFDQASQYFNEAEPAESAADQIQQLYNQATTLAQARQFEAALTAYENLLSQVPDHTAAQHNKALIESILGQQQSQEQQSQDNESSDNSQSKSQSTTNTESNEKQQQSSQQANQNNEPQSGQEHSGQEQQDAHDNLDNTEQNESKTMATNKSEDENEPQNERQKDAEEQTTLAEPANIMNQKDEETQQALQQWLEQVPDDPSGLLRRKFLLESQQRQRSGNKTLDHRNLEELY